MNNLEKYIQAFVDAFGDDIIDFSSFEKGKEILAAKYGVEFGA